MNQQLIKEGEGDLLLGILGGFVAAIFIGAAIASMTGLLKFLGALAAIVFGYNILVRWIIESIRKIVAGMTGCELDARPEKAKEAQS